MKIASKTLSAFIHDFNLSIHNAVCFDAIIIFKTKFKTVQLESKVHIIGSAIENLNTIYLLNPDVVEHGIPYIIPEDGKLIKYIPYKCLVISGKTLMYINYILSIYPQSPYCEPATLKELSQKINK